MSGCCRNPAESPVASPCVCRGWHFAYKSGDLKEDVCKTPGFAYKSGCLEGDVCRKGGFAYKSGDLKGDVYKKQYLD
jgi:hypothetical protein